MKKRAGDAVCDGYQVALSVEDFYLGRSGHFRKIYGAAAADQGGGFFGGGDAGKLGHELTGMNKKHLGSSLLRGLF